MRDDAESDETGMDPRATRLGARRTPAAAPPSTTPPSTPAREGAPAAAPVAGTQLGRRAVAARATAPDTVPTDGPAEPSDGPDLYRFGPGVPDAAPAAPAWTVPTRPATGPRRRRRPTVGALLTVLLVAGALAYLLTRVSDPVVAHAQTVAATPTTQRCDTVVDVVGTIATNGRPGSVSYQWIRSDGQPTSVLTQSVSRDATTTQVHLQWSFSGRGRYQARATLRVLEPAPASEATGTFTYACP